MEFGSLRYSKNNKFIDLSIVLEKDIACVKKYVGNSNSVVDSEGYSSYRKCSFQTFFVSSSDAFNVLSFTSSGRRMGFV